MKLEITEEDPLANVRHRAPKLMELGVDYGILPELTGFGVKLAWILGHALIMRGLGDSGITPLRFSMLEVVSRNPGLQQTQLANALALSRPATTLAVDFWEERGCVERQRLPGDRRSFGVFITPEGTEQLQRLRTIMRDADRAMIADLTPEENAELRRILRKIHK